MMARIISFVSSKGGSGKTVTAASFAYFLAELENKVLLIDADAATNGLTLLFLKDIANEKRKVTDINLKGIFDQTETESVTPVITKEKVNIIPSTFRMFQTEEIGPEKFKINLKTTIDNMIGEYDYILIDAQAGTDLYAKVVVSVSNDVIIVTEFDPVSLEGVERFKQIFSQILNPSETWILFNKVLPEFAESIGSNLSIARYLDPIPWDADVVRAFSRRKLALNFEEGNIYTLSILQSLTSLLQSEIEEAALRWKNSKEESIRKPARTQLSEKLDEIKTLKNALAEIQYRTEYLREKPRRILRSFLISIVSFFALSFSLFGFLEIQSPKYLTYIFMAIVPLIAVLYVGYDTYLRKKYFYIEKETTSDSIDIQTKIDQLEDEKERLSILTKEPIEKLIRHKM